MAAFLWSWSSRRVVSVMKDMTNGVVFVTFGIFLQIFHRRKKRKHLHNVENLLEARCKKTTQKVIIKNFCRQIYERKSVKQKEVTNFKFGPLLAIEDNVQV